MHRVPMGAAEEAVIAQSVNTGSRSGFYIITFGADTGMGVRSIDRTCKHIFQGAAFCGAAHSIAAIPASIGVDMIGVAAVSISRSVFRVVYTH